jgi:hypothetical protein
VGGEAAGIGCGQGVDVQRFLEGRLDAQRPGAKVSTQPGTRRTGRFADIARRNSLKSEQLEVHENVRPHQPCHGVFHVGTDAVDPMHLVSQRGVWRFRDDFQKINPY